MTPKHTFHTALIAALALAATLLSGCDKRESGAPPMPSASSAASTPG